MTADVADLQKIVDEKTKSMPSFRLLSGINLLVEIVLLIRDMIPSGHPKGPDFTNLSTNIYSFLKIKYEEIQELSRSSLEVEAMWEEFRKAIGRGLDSRGDLEMSESRSVGRE